MTQNISDFLRQNVDTSVKTKEIKFSRFKSPFVIKPVTAEENSALQKQATIKKRDKRTQMTTTDVDQQKYVDGLVLASLVSPDVNAKELQESWGTLGDPSATLKNMLFVGEYTELLDQIQELSGFDLEENVEDLADKVKN